MEKVRGVFLRVWDLYYDGFRNMSSWGKQVWIVILIKLFILFFILRLFFFPNFLKTNFKTDADRGNYVLENLVEPKK